MAYFDATSSFDAALSEVDFLAERAQAASGNSHDYLAYLKAAFVLLGAKFEAFAENIVEDYVVELASLLPKTKHLARDLRIHSTNHLLNQCITNTSFSGRTQSIQSLLAAAELWDEEYQIRNISISNKFNYGKHGSEEIKNLFRRIGFQDVLNDCQVMSNSTNSMLPSLMDRVAITPDIDSLTHIRNNIIHSDASPNNITHQQLLGYKDKLWEFGFVVDLRLDRELQLVKAAIAANP